MADKEKHKSKDKKSKHENNQQYGYGYPPQKHMSGGHGGGGEWSVLWTFVLIVAGLWVLWYFTGGPAQTQQNSQPFLKPLQPLDTGQTYGPTKN